MNKNKAKRKKRKETKEKKRPRREKEKKKKKSRHRERMKKQKARMIIRHAHQKYRFPSRARGYDSGLSCLFPRLCRNDFRQTKSLDRTALQSINARRPSSNSCLGGKRKNRVYNSTELLPRNKKFLRTDRAGQKAPVTGREGNARVPINPRPLIAAFPTVHECNNHGRDHRTWLKVSGEIWGRFNRLLIDEERQKFHLNFHSMDEKFESERDSRV